MRIELSSARNREKNLMQGLPGRDHLPAALRLVSERKTPVSSIAVVTKTPCPEVQCRTQSPGGDRLP